MNKLSRRDIKALKLGAVAAAAIVAFVVGSIWLEHWADVRESLARAKADFEQIDIPKTRKTGLMEIVPAFEMPQPEQQQKFLFRKKLNEQLKQAGIGAEPLRILSATQSNQPGYELLRVKFTGTGKYDKVLDLLANLRTNPYLAGIEQFEIRCDEKKRDQLSIDMVVATFVKKGGNL